LKDIFKIAQKPLLFWLIKGVLLGGKVRTLPLRRSPFIKPNKGDLGGKNRAS